MDTRMVCGVDFWDEDGQRNKATFIYARTLKWSEINCKWYTSKWPNRFSNSSWHYLLYSKFETILTLRVFNHTVYISISNRLHHFVKKCSFVPKVKSHGLKSFSYNGCKLWNQLPSDIRAITNLVILKTVLNNITYLWYNYSIDL